MYTYEKGKVLCTMLINILTGRASTCTLGTGNSTGETLRLS